MRFNEFKHPVKEEEITEFAPVIAGAVGAASRVGAKMGSAVAKGVKVVGDKIAKSTTSIIQKAQDKVAGAVLKKGANIVMPATDGKQHAFDIQDVKGDQVTVANPKAKPGDPNAFVYTKKELEPMVKAKADAVAGKGTVPGGSKGISPR